MLEIKGYEVFRVDSGADQTMGRLTDPQQRARMKHDIENGLAGWNSNYVRQSGGWQGIVIARIRTEKNASLAGKTLEELAKIRDKDPADAFFDLLVEEHGQVFGMPFMMNGVLPASLRDSA